MLKGFTAREKEVMLKFAKDSLDDAATREGMKLLLRLLENQAYDRYNEEIDPEIEQA